MRLREIDKSDVVTRGREWREGSKKVRHKHTVTDNYWVWGNGHTMQTTDPIPKKCSPEL